MAKRSSKKGGCGGLYGGKRKRTMRGGAYGAGPAIAVGALQYDYVDTSKGAGEYTNSAGGFSDPSRGGNATGGGRRRGSRRTRRVIKKKSVATIKRLLKAKGLKVSGSRRAVTARARKARIPMKGGKSVAGTNYESFTGNGDAGLTSPFVGAHRVDGNILDMGGYGLDTTGSGGAREVA